MIVALGAIDTAVGIGASLSQLIAEAIVHHFDFAVGFLFLAAAAAAGLSILFFFMPETLPEGRDPALRGWRATP